MHHQNSENGDAHLLELERKTEELSQLAGELSKAAKAAGVCGFAIVLVACPGAMALDIGSSDAGGGTAAMHAKMLHEAVAMAYRESDARVTKHGGRFVRRFGR